MDKATFQEAVEFVRDINQKCDESHGDQPEGGIVCLYELRPPDLREDLVHDLIYCSTGIMAAWDALDMLTGKLQREGNTLPPDLARWVADRPPRPTKRGPNPDRDVLRNIGMMIAIRALELRGWSTTRRVTRNGKELRHCCAEGGTACDVVGVAAGIGGYKNVEGIWTGSADPKSPIYRNSSIPSYARPKSF
ncbi:MAG: hypothetical protein OXN89_05035 [Bryobacterales bacterium]|nr:hypothetical protein [Bryobacterales bacterium]